MTDILDKLTGDQALIIVRSLAAKGGAISEAVLAAAKDVLMTVDIEDVGDDVYFALDLIDVEDLWDRAGSSRDGYMDEVEAATELLEDEFEPFFDQVDRYHELDMRGQERDYCMGVVLGAYRYVKESNSEFRNWCEDLPVECVGELLDRWRTRTPDLSFRASMNDFIRARCPGWAEYLIKKDDPNN
jgi:hypothetical protein